METLLGPDPAVLNTVEAPAGLILVTLFRLEFTTYRLPTVSIVTPRGVNAREANTVEAPAGVILVMLFEELFVV